jgi:tetratricopeptide (TPR) repeat protein
MTNKKGKQAPRQGSAETARSGGSESYDAAVKEFAAALELFQKGHLQEARDRFAKLAAASGDEYRLAEQSRTYTTICDRRLAPETGAPRTADELYRAAVGLANAGHLDEAEGLLDKAVDLRPGEATYLYARASVHAMKGNADRAAKDLRRSLELDARLRHQAANDPDFERVRDEAVFIDVIEPTPAGA